MVLYHDGKNNELLNICDNSSKAQRMDLPPEEKTDVDHFIKTHWNAFSVQDNILLFMGLAWVIPIIQNERFDLKFDLNLLLSSAAL